MSVTSCDENLLNTKHNDNGIVPKKKPSPADVNCKVFQDRESVLTEMFQNKHILAIYRFFVTMFICISINSVLYDFIYNGTISVGYLLTFKMLRNFHIVLVLWVCLDLITLCLCPCFKYWATKRLYYIPNSISLFVWDKMWITCFVTYILFILYMPIWITYKYNIGYGSSIIIAMKATVMLMKTYAFVRTNAAQVIKNNVSKNYPKFSHFLYFLFAPTLVYSDSYPRSKGSIRWRLVGIHFIEILAVLLLYGIIFEKGYVSQLKYYGIKPYRWGDIVMIAFNNSFYSFAMILLSFYLILHLWLNVLAEIFQFSDKLFYEDWWTSSSYARYYRTWNCIVQDWLYAYIYKDFYEIFYPGNKFIAKQAVFFISALFHDYIASIANGFCIPFHMVLFFGLGNYLRTVKFSNAFLGSIFFVYSLGLGMSTIFVIGTTEYFCRLNVEQSELTISSFFTPTLLKCMHNSTY